MAEHPGPRIALVVAPFTDINLQRARQMGVTDIVARYPGADVRELSILQKQVQSYGMNITVIERHLPIESIKVGGPSTDIDIEKMKNLVRNMGACKIPILCYNIMPGGDWGRTSFHEKQRGGCLVCVQYVAMLSFSMVHDDVNVCSEGCTSFFVCVISVDFERK